MSDNISMTVLGVAGTLTRDAGVARSSGCFTCQRWVSEARPIEGYGDGARMRVELRFDDECGNGHNTFSVTADVRRPTRGRRWGREWVVGGCMHEAIARSFPELAPLVRWHLVSTDRPMHYLANTLYLAGDRDCWGRRKGEPSAFAYGVRFNGVPVTHVLEQKFFEWLLARHGTGEFQLCEFVHERDPKTYGPHYSFLGFGERWHEAPFRNRAQADEFRQAMKSCEVEFVRLPIAYSQGKERELDAARAAASWPEATDTELSLPPRALQALLEARLPLLLAQFRHTMESIGFLWSAEPDEKGSETAAS